MITSAKGGRCGLGVACGLLAVVAMAGPARAVHEGRADHEGRAEYEGRVVARSGLVVRTGPSYQYRALGSKQYGTVVGIVCRVKGQRVEGNPVWYKLSDASYAWSSERHIVQDGKRPRWC
ncbi:hypothetical protein [Streptomyces sp. NBRC 110611]|uniref:hypothetical protein n=1 Tax=Streptomyces sp. NBRC 110611 TaxID=1621259 RepID=UPI000D1515F1|nr:hypothetical protein [Streptomyces sp. NBRC 110611]